jgi:CBS domain
MRNYLRRYVYLQVPTGALLSAGRVRDLMSKDCNLVDPDTTLEDFVREQLMRTGRCCFRVVKGGRLAGLITPD